MRRTFFSRLHMPFSPEEEDLDKLASKMDLLEKRKAVIVAKANIDSLNQMVLLNQERIEWVERMQRRLETGCDLIKTMSILAFVVGVILILVPFFLYWFSTPRDTDFLWFSGIGMAETLTILVYRPMDRVQKATSDMAQSTIMLNSWATEIGLILLLIKLDHVGSDQVKETAGLVGDATRKHVAWIESYAGKEPETEPKKTEREEEKVPA